MVRRSVKSRKGISTAIGAVFFILIVIVAFVTIWTINSYETRYQDVKTKMNEWDIQRISENLNIRNVTEAMTGYTFNLTVDNIGGVLVNTARIYVHDQTNKSNLYVYDPQNGTSIGFINGAINTGEVSHKIAVKGTALDSDHTYRIILATERGRQFSYNHPPPSEEKTKPPPVVYVFGSMRVKYNSNGLLSSTRSDSDPDGWCNSWVPWKAITGQALADKKNLVLVRVNITNTCGHAVNFTSGSLVYQGSGKQGNRQEYLGGVLSTSVFMQNEETKSIIFKLSYNIQTNEPDDYPVAYSGLAGFSTDARPDEDFLSGAVMLDALLVPSFDQPP